jgi:hypothetical protein
MQNILRDLRASLLVLFGKKSKVIQSNPKESRKEWMMEMMIKTGLNNGNNKDWQFWQQNNHPIELSSNKIIDQKLEYLYYNPVVAGYVESPEDWLYSSAKDYYGNQGLLEVELIY